MAQTIKVHNDKMDRTLLKVLNDTIESKNFATKMCSTLNINSTEYAYWNGIRCQAEVTINLISN